MLVWSAIAARAFGKATMTNSSVAPAATMSVSGASAGDARSRQAMAIAASAPYHKGRVRLRQHGQQEPGRRKEDHRRLDAALPEERGNDTGNERGRPGKARAPDLRAGECEQRDKSCIPIVAERVEAQKRERGARVTGGERQIGVARQGDVNIGERQRCHEKRDRQRGKRRKIERARRAIDGERQRHGDLPPGPIHQRIIPAAERD